MTDTMFVWNEKLADYGMELVQYRIAFMERLTKLAQKAHFEASGEKLELFYRPRFAQKEDFLKKLENSLEREIEQGYTLYGPHREDFEIFINEKEARLFGSQGQQRSSALSLKLSESEIIKEITGDEPVILLDDVMSELDLTRQDYILNNISGRQVFITCCDPNTVLRRTYLAGKIPDKQVFITCTEIDALLGQGRVFTVQDGQAEPEQSYGK